MWCSNCLCSFLQDTFLNLQNEEEDKVMVKNILSYSFAGLVALSTAGTASATLLDFTPSNLSVTGGNTYDSVGMTVDGIAVSVSAYTIENDGNGNISSSSQITGTGIGVYVSDSNNMGVESHPSSSVDSHSMDGGSSTSTSDPDEGLLFSFNQVVSLSYINFDSFGGSDDFNLTVDGILKLVDFDGGSTSQFASQVTGEPDEFNFSDISGTEFLFWADSDSDKFRIDRMTVHAIPEPTTLLLFGVGLIGLCLVRRKVIR